MGHGPSSRDNHKASGKHPIHEYKIVVPYIKTDPRIAGKSRPVVEVPSNPPYQRGDGPPRNPISLLPSFDDRASYIIDTTIINEQLMYVVGWRDSVRRENVLVRDIEDYVSLYTLERFDLEQCRQMRAAEAAAARAEKDRIAELQKRKMEAKRAMQEAETAGKGIEYRKATFQIVIPSRSSLKRKVTDEDSADTDAGMSARSSSRTSRVKINHADGPIRQPSESEFLSNETLGPSERRNSVAASSSIEAASVYERLEKKATNRSSVEVEEEDEEESDDELAEGQLKGYRL